MGKLKLFKLRVMGMMKKVIGVIVLLSLALFISACADSTAQNSLTVFLTEDTTNADSYARENWEEMFLAACSDQDIGYDEKAELGDGIKIESENE